MEASWPLACYQCERTFKHKKTLVRHLRSSHSDQEFACRTCDRSFSRRDIRDRHEDEQHGDKAGTIECNVCGAQIRARSLTDHRKSRVCKAIASFGPSTQASLLRWLASSTPFQPAAVSDPLLITVHLWFGIMDAHTRGGVSDYTGLLGLRYHAILTVRIALQTSPIAADIDTYCAVALLAACETQFLDHGAAEIHCKGLRFLGNHLERSSFEGKCRDRLLEIIVHVGYLLNIVNAGQSTQQMAPVAIACLLVDMCGEKYEKLSEALTQQVQSYAYAGYRPHDWISQIFGIFRCGTETLMVPIVWIMFTTRRHAPNDRRCTSQDSKAINQRHLRYAGMITQAADCRDLRTMAALCEW